MERYKLSKFCNNCGAPLDSGSQFCTKCGTAIESDKFQPTLPSKNIFVLKLGVFISSAVLILSSFLPYASASVFGFTYAQSLIDGGDGIFFIAVAIIAIVAAALKKPRLTLAFGVLAVCLCFFEMANISSGLDDLGDYAGFIIKGAGYYLNAISGIALAIFCVLFFLATKNKKKK